MKNEVIVRQVLYNNYDGQSCPFYAAASSGLVESLMELEHLTSKLEDKVDKELLQETWKDLRANLKHGMASDHRIYILLPWVMNPGTEIKTIKDIQFVRHHTLALITISQDVAACLDCVGVEVEDKDIGLFVQFDNCNDPLRIFSFPGSCTPDLSKPLTCIYEAS